MKWCYTLKKLLLHTLGLCILSQFSYSQIWQPSLAKLEISNVRVFTDNAEAWKEKLRLIQSATQSIDMSYFIIDYDPSTARLMEAVIQKANDNKNLKVRILVDYFMSELQLPFLKYIESTHSNIEIKRFGSPSPEWIKNLQALGVNPSLFIKGLATQDKTLIQNSFEKTSHISKVSEALESLTNDMPALTFMLTVFAKIKLLSFLNFDDGSGFLDFLNRTHHKLLLVDDKCFQMGGRNLSDEYHIPPQDPLMLGLIPPFPKRKYSFIDLDVSACAKDSTKIKSGFEELWEDTKHTVGLNFEVPSRVSCVPKETPAISSDEFNDKVKASRHLIEGEAQAQINLAPTSRNAFYLENSAITQKYIEKIEKLEKGDTLLIANAYFFITEDWVFDCKTQPLYNLYTSLIWAAERGANIHIYTNSIDSTDLSIVNEFSYNEYKSLVQAGIKIFELAPNQGSLHMKGAFFKYESPQLSEFLIGSYNLDPRSHMHDTNNALIFEILDSVEAQKSLASFQSTIQITKEGFARTWVAIDDKRLEEITASLLKNSNNKKALIQRALLRQFKSQI